MLDDLKFAWRRLRNAPGFAAVAIATLALSIGANTAVFSIADAVLFRPLPYRDVDQLDVVQIGNRKTGQHYTMVSYEYLQAINEGARQAGISEFGLLEDSTPVVVSGRDGLERVPILEATPNYFQILGVHAARGRVFEARDLEQVGRAAMISYDSWRQRFGGDEQIVGRSVTLGTKTIEIVGVLPPGFTYPAITAPTRPEVVTVMAPPAPGAKGGTFYPIFRRDAGTSRQAAQARIDIVTRPIALRDPATADTAPDLQDVREILFPTGRPIMRWLLAAASLVLLIGCANLANMLLARGQRRERDTGLRAALGASRMRLIRPVLFESLLIGVAGAAVAVAVTGAAFDALLRQVPRAAYGDVPVGVDARVVILAFVMGMAGGLMFAVVPAWRSARLDVQTLMQARHVGGARRAGRLGRPMVAVQVALAVVLVFGAVVTGRAFFSVLRVPLGFTADNVATIDIYPGGRTAGTALQGFYVTALESLSRRREVVAAGATYTLPLSGGAAFEGANIPGSTNRATGIIHVLPGYFETIGMKLNRGRLLTPQDVLSNPDAAVISESAAHVLFPDRDALGGVFEKASGRQFTVVGVVADVLHSMPARARDAARAYVFPHNDTRVLRIVARTRTKRDALLADFKRDLAPLAPSAAPTIRWWSESISGITAYKNPRFQTIVLGSFAALALGLTALGIFGVVSFLVAMRTREMGVRLAIGATPKSLVTMMVRQSLTPVTVGLVLGVFATRALGKLAEAQLFEVKANDATTLALAVVTVLAAALSAAYRPARHASRVDPIIVLRSE